MTPATFALATAALWVTSSSRYPLVAVAGLAACAAVFRTTTNDNGPGADTPGPVQAAEEGDHR